MYTLYEVWNPIRTSIATSILNAYNTVTTYQITSQEASKIETLIFNYCHALMDCRMLFSEELTLTELQTILTRTIIHKCYSLVNEWKALDTLLDTNKGKIIHQESFYDVADTPRVETKDYAELDIKIKQLNFMSQNLNSLKDCYKEIKSLVQTIYY